MEYNFRDIEKKWQQLWKERKTYCVENNSAKPKYYALDMFPYPSGAGLHVGHPLGYIASDIVSRYKRLCGYNVLHPMGFDSFGLPAEQYAIQTGQHPDKTTRENIKRYKEQMDKIGFSFDWDREVWTSNPDYYKWTQWIFLQIFKSWYNKKTDRAENIETLISIFEKEGFSTSLELTNVDIENDLKSFTADQWKNFSEKEKSDVLMNFRLAYLGEAWVNWCPAMGTVLANDEVKDGVSERGGYPVERKRMPQWSMRITSYADRLLKDLDALDWTESMKEAQRNWIGRSEGTSLRFKIQDSRFDIEVFTTRPDTIFGVTFVTLAPEHELVSQITTPENKKTVDEYVTMAKNRSERERMADVKKVTGVFTGAYVIHPFSNEKVPVWIGDYVLAGYGTGAVMGVPAHDSRDFSFAKHFGLKIAQVIEGPAGWDFSKESYDSKDTKCINSDFLNGMEVKDAMKKIITEIEKRNIGKGKVNYRLRDAAFGRQRYWGEPIPIYYENGIPKPVDEKDLPLVLPQVDKYLPTESGEPPLARAEDWVYSPQPRPFSPSTGSGQAGEGGTLAREGTVKKTVTENRYREIFTASPEKWKLLKERARDLRKNQTEAENILWQELRNKNTGFKIRRQHAIETFIVDFVCLDKKLVIEVDGGYHDSPEQKEYDDVRTFVLNQLGYEVIRFQNDEVTKNSSAVVEKVIKALATREVLPTGEDLGGVSIQAEKLPLETTTMPGWAGSSWYFLRYMDPHNEKELVSKDAVNYWKNVDLYIGGTEHATGHLLYVRFWTKFLFDRGIIPFEEPAQKLINQGMIQGVSAFTQIWAPFIWVKPLGKTVLPKFNSKTVFIISKQKAERFLNGDEQVRAQMLHIYDLVFLKKQSSEWSSLIRNVHYELIYDANNFENSILFRHVDIKFILEKDELNTEEYTKWRSSWPSLQGINEVLEYILEEDGKYICSREVEKMSKSKYNVVTPDSICDSYGADTLRMYEMFLGPLEQSKPWNTNGITGVHGFLKRFWRMFYEENRQDEIQNSKFKVQNSDPTEAELKVLHRTLKKIREDIERYSFNTCVSQFMICVNELMELKCSKRGILEPLVIALSPFAPHIAEELWEQLGNKTSVTIAAFPKIDEKYLVDDSFNYPVQINGKVRFNFSISLALAPAEIEKEILSSEEAKKWLEGKTPKKVIVVPKRIVNIVL